MKTWTVLLAWAAAACGGRVVVDHEGVAGDIGGSGPLPSDEEVCAAYCEDQAELCGAGAIPCADQCHAELSSAGPCHDLQVAAHLCYAALYDNGACSSPECTAALRAVDACITPAGKCDNDRWCGPGPGACENTCGGVVYSVDCPEKGGVLDPDVGTPCTCRVDGVTVGTCAANALDPMIWGGCCTASFAESG